MWTTAERAITTSVSPPSPPRLLLRPAAWPRPLLDGGWWPRSADPVTELPGLIQALQADGPAAHHRRITHILLRVGDWDSRPRRLRVGDPAETRAVRLSWFDTLPTGLLIAIWGDGRRVDLLTVPAFTGHAEAQAAMELAAHGTNHLRTPDLVAALTPLTPTAPAAPAGPPAPAATDVIQQSAWESEGGRPREHAST
jgi:hypothetical protein